MTVPGRTRQAIRALLRGAGLAPAGDLARARATAERHKADAQAKARKLRVNAATIAALQARQEAGRQLQVVEQAERMTLKKALAYHWEELDRLETIYGPYQERIPAQLAVAIGSRRRADGAVAPPDEGRLAAVCPDYAAALARWESDGPLADVVHASIGGARWSFPAAPTPPDQADAPPAERWLPLAELATVRQFAVGGVMLDIGAGSGQACIPRVLLGDFDRVYAAEPDPGPYQCLVGNVLASGVRGSVLPDRVTLARPLESAPGAGLASALTFEAWMTRLQIPGDAVRFVRIATGPSGVELLRAGVSLLSRREIVWQVDLDRDRLRTSAEAVRDLARLVGAHFTHFKELGTYPAAPWRRAGEAKRLFKDPADAGPAGLLLFNLR